METVTSVPRETMVMARLLGAHGIALACGVPLLGRPLTALSIAAGMIATVPFVGWAFGPAPWRRNQVLGFGVLPFATLVAAALLERSSEDPTDLIGAIRVVAGVFAILVAVGLVDRDPPRELPVEVGDRPAPRAPTARARWRTALLVSLGLGTSAIVLVAPALHDDATGAERAFAAVVATVLGATVCLAAVPVAMRKERRPASTRARRDRLALLAIVLALLALAVERGTR